MAERRRARASIRVRTTVGATVVVGLALAVAAVAVVLVVRRDLTRSVDAAAEARAADVVAAVEAGQAPTAVVGGDDDDELLVQVVASDGTVLAASEDVEGVAPLAAGEQDPTGASVPGQDGSYRVVAEAARPGDDAGGGDDGEGDDADGDDDGDGDGGGAAVGADEVLVVVARSAEAVTEGTEAVVGSLAVGFPLVLLVVAATTWAVTSRALRPVEAIRSEVAAISDAELDRRVPEPGGRDEIARLAATMNAMLDRLEAGRDRNRRFVSDASHELRSPIATIRHELEVVLADPSAADVEGLATRLLAEDLRMQALVEDLLLLARSDEGSLATIRRPVDVDDLVLADAARLRSLGTVTVDATGVGAGRVDGDAGQLGRVVRNLADNAARHASGAVALGVTTVDGHVRLWVDDDGPGIPVADRERVFERFTRLDEARARHRGGYGLGLAIVAEVVRSHGGRIGVTESPLGGARVLVELPEST